MRAYLIEIVHNGKETGASDAGTLTDLEVVYNCIEERENDFKVAAQIGQMLVERNSQLMDELEGTKRDWEAEVISIFNCVLVVVV
mgnify:CR=1 FL=1